jgi:large subunit ribosomal protein L3
MPLNLSGRKEGMTQVFDEVGNAVPCTILKVEPNVIVQIKTVDQDGYSAIQLGSRKTTKKNKSWKKRQLSKAEEGHCVKAGIEPLMDLSESRFDSIDGYELGQAFGVTEFNDVKFVDVTAVSKGKGFQGCMKVHNFSGGPASHGSHFHRAPGSLGMRSTPGRVYKGRKNARRLGGEKVTIQSLPVIAVMEEENVLIVKGSVPGPRGGMVTIQQAVKKSKN